MNISKLFNTNELTKEWEAKFYEGSWRCDTMTLTTFEENLIEEMTTFLPRHMPIEDWNLPYAEEIILILRRHLKEVGDKHANESTNSRIN